jgi:uncharacterized protein YfaS (alpha-2-macroglobulin family)
MSRFLPAVVTAKTLKDLGLAPDAVMGRAFGGIEQAHAAATHKGGKRNLDKLREITGRGLERLKDFQHDDGGWGWWKEGSSDPFMTAYIVWGLALAQQAEVNVPADIFERGRGFLQQHVVTAEDAPDLQAWMLHALAASASGAKAGDFEEKAFQNLWEKRDRLNAYTRALFALSAHYFGKLDEAKTLARNLENGVKREGAPDRSRIAPGAAAGQTGNVMATAHWGADGVTWRWSDGGVEATATALRALLAIDPKNDLVHAAANWLIQNRRGAQWSNTRDTAMVVLALNDYLRVTKEAEGELGYEVFFNGKSLARRHVAGADIFSAPSAIEIPADLVQGGKNEIRIVRTSGAAPIYFAVHCSLFSLEEPVQPAGNEIFVARKYYRLRPVATLLKGYTYDREEVKPGETVASGERVEAVVTVEAKNHYEYLVFEDLKPAGLEAVEVRSGEDLSAVRIPEGELDKPEGGKAQGESRPVHQELRDRKVALFIDKLPQGIWQMRYELRAEVPGEFHALPVLGHAMYVPEIRANSGETKIIVRERSEEANEK